MKYKLDSFLFQISNLFGINAPDLFGKNTPKFKEANLLVDETDLDSHVHLSYAQYDKLLQQQKKRESILL
jgi:hypothetical protein